MEGKERTQVSISRKLYADIKEYCSLNGLKLTEYVDGLLKDAFLRDKYGDRPFANQISAQNEKNAENLQDSPKIVVIEDEDVAKNEVVEPPEPVRDTPRDNVSRNVARIEETATIPDTPAQIDGKPTKTKRKIQVK